MRQSAIAMAFSSAATKPLAPDSEVADEPLLGGDGAHHGPERVPAVEPPERGSEVGPVAMEGLHQQRQGGAHGGARDQHQEEGDAEADQVEGDGLVEQRSEQGGECRWEERETPARSPRPWLR